MTTNRPADRSISEARYRELFRGNAAGVFFGSLGGSIIEANPALAHLFGYASAEDMAGVDFGALYWEPHDRAGILTALRSGDRISFRELRFRHLDGSMWWGLCNAAVLPTSADTPLVQGTIIDISARKAAEDRVSVAAEERRELLARLFTAEEDERRRVAGEIHDDSLQLLAAAQMYLHSALEGTGRETAVVAALDRVQTAAERLRALVLGLRPTVLEDRGLGAGLRDSLGELLGDDMRWELQADLPEEPEPDIRMALYRICQEALANVRKHAHASRAEVHVQAQDGGVAIVVRDDGAGFAREEVNRAQVGHLGLRTMRERAESAGGWMRMQSEPGSGTTLEVWVPAPGARP